MPSVSAGTRPSRNSSTSFGASPTATDVEPAGNRLAVRSAFYCRHEPGIAPSRDSMSAVTSIAVRVGEIHGVPSEFRQPLHGPVYGPAAAVAALIRSFTGHGQSGVVVLTPFMYL